MFAPVKGWREGGCPCVKVEGRMASGEVEGRPCVGEENCLPLLGGGGKGPLCKGGGERVAPVLGWKEKNWLPLCKRRGKGLPLCVGEGLATPV